MGWLEAVLLLFALSCFIIGGFLFWFACRYSKASSKQNSIAESSKPEPIIKRKLDRMRQITPAQIPIFDKTGSKFAINIPKIHRKPISDDWESNG